MDRRTEMIDVVNMLFSLAMKIQNDYIKNSEFPELSMNEMHVIEAASKEQFPTMGNVAKRLKITVGSLTTSVKSICRKGFLTKEKSSIDQRMTFLRITDKGYRALEVHNEFHRQLNHVYSSRIPDDQVDWVYSTLGIIYNDLLDYQKSVKEHKD